MLSLDGDAEAGITIARRMTPCDVAQAEAGIIESPLLQQLAGAGVDAHERRLHALQIMLLVRQCPWHAAVGDDQVAFAIE